MQLSNMLKNSNKIVLFVLDIHTSAVVSVSEKFIFVFDNCYVTKNYKKLKVMAPKN